MEEFQNKVQPSQSAPAKAVSDSYTEGQSQTEQKVSARQIQVTETSNRNKATSYHLGTTNYVLGAL